LAAASRFPRKPPGANGPPARPHHERRGNLQRLESPVAGAPGWAKNIFSSVARRQLPDQSGRAILWRPGLGGRSARPPHPHLQAKEYTSIRPRSQYRSV